MFVLLIFCIIYFYEKKCQILKQTRKSKIIAVRRYQKKWKKETTLKSAVYSDFLVEYVNGLKSPLNKVVNDPIFKMTWSLLG